MRFEKDRRRRGNWRERKLQRQHIEVPQTITAQRAYMMGLWVEQATEVAGKANEQLLEKLWLARQLSRSSRRYGSINRP